MGRRGLIWALRISRRPFIPFKFLLHLPFRYNQFFFVYNRG